MTTTITIAGVTFTSDTFSQYGWLAPVTVGGSALPAWQAMFSAMQIEMAANLVSAGTVSSAAGSALPVIKYGWDTGTSDADPGSGRLRADNATLTSATKLYLSTGDANAVDVSAIIGIYDDSTSTIKGYLALGHRTDPSKWVIYSVSGSVVTAAGYRKVTVAYVVGPGGFSAADPVAVGFTRTGDVGDTGAPGSITGGNATGAINETAVTLASASTTDIGGAAGNAVRVSGVATITALGTAQSGARRSLTFSGAATLTQNPTSLILPGAANIVTAAGDAAEFESLGSGNWRCVNYMRSSGLSLLGGALFSAVTTKAASFTATAADAGTLFVCTGTLTATLPTAAALGANKYINITNESFGTVSVQSSSTISGYVGITLSNGQSAILTSDGTSYHVLGTFLGGSYNVTLDPTQAGAGFTLSNGNLTAAYTNSGTSHIRATAPRFSGLRYFEAVTTTSSDAGIGLSDTSSNLSDMLGGDAHGWAWEPGTTGGSEKRAGGSSSAYGTTPSGGGTVGIAINFTTGNMFAAYNNVWQASSNPVTGANPMFTGVAGTLFPALGRTAGGSTQSVTFHFSSASLTYAAPTGYLAWGD